MWSTRSGIKMSSVFEIEGVRKAVEQLFVENFFDNDVSNFENSESWKFQLEDIRTEHNN